MQPSLQANLHGPTGIRNHNLKSQAAVDLRLRPHGHWDRWLQYVLDSVRLRIDVKLIAY